MITYNVFPHLTYSDICDKNGNPIFTTTTFTSKKTMDKFIRSLDGYYFTSDENGDTVEVFGHDITKAIPTLPYATMNHLNRKTYEKRVIHDTRIIEAEQISDKKRKAVESALSALLQIEDFEGYKNNPVGKCINYLQATYIGKRDLPA